MIVFRERTLLALLLAAVALIAAGLVLPDWLRFLVQISLATGLASLGVAMQMRAGLVSFGQGLFYCLGGYAAGMAGHFLAITDVFVLLALGVVLALGVGGILGLLIARYRQIFFAMLTLAFSMILYGMLVKAEALGSTDGFNLPRPTFLGYAPEGDTLRLTAYVLTVGVALMVAAAVHLFLAAPLGLLAEGIRENELRVEYLGASARHLAYLTYLTAAAVSALGGGLAAISIGHVEPDMAYWTTSGQFVFVALLAGTGHAAAPLIGAFLLEMVRVYALEISPNTWQMILGITMLAIITFLPGGLWSLVRIVSPRSR